MSRERRRSRYALVPPAVEGERDWTDEVADLVHDREADFLQRLELAHAKNKVLGLYAQARIIEHIHMDELDRLDPTNRWAVENGDEKPCKGQVNWGDL